MFWSFIPDLPVLTITGSSERQGASFWHVLWLPDRWSLLSCPVGLSCLWALTGHKSRCHISPRHRSRVLVCLPSLKRLITNRCRFMSCWLSCLPLWPELSLFFYQTINYIHTFNTLLRPHQLNICPVNLKSASWNLMQEDFMSENIKVFLLFLQVNFKPVAPI